MDTEEVKKESLSQARLFLRDYIGDETAAQIAPYLTWTVLVACLIPNLGGFLSGLPVRKSLKTWYRDLKKAPWNPPAWAFGPAWTTLYTLMGFASYLVWRDGGGFSEKTMVPLGLFAVQLIVNWIWAPLFFGFHLLKWSLVDMIVLDVLVAACAVSFSNVNHMAGLLFFPYMAWLCLATTLMIYVYTHNPEGGAKKHHRKQN